MKKEKVLRFLGNAFVVYAMILFAVTAFFDGRQFGKDVSIVNYIIRMILGFVPALIFAVPGILMLECVSDSIEEPNALERRALRVNLRDKGNYVLCVFASFCAHVSMIVLSIIWKIISLAVSFLGWFFSIMFGR